MLNPIVFDMRIPILFDRILSSFQIVREGRWPNGKCASTRMMSGSELWLEANGKNKSPLLTGKKFKRLNFFVQRLATVFWKANTHVH